MVKGGGLVNQDCRKVPLIGSTAQVSVKCQIIPKPLPNPQPGYPSV